MERVNASHRTEERYRTTTLACIVAALLLANAVVRFWPDFESEFDPNAVFDTRGERIELEMITQTQIVAKPPPPPAPQPPVPVPDDVVLDYEDIELTEEIDYEEGDEDATAEVLGPRIVAQADQGPKPIRFVEPEYTAEARKKKIKASILVEVLIDEKGRVLESRIIDRFIYDKKNQPPIPVRAIGFGIEEAALSAADRWRFRPARHGGRVVQTYYTLTFKFGV